MNSERYSSLVLGTTQLGMPYGIANKSGQPDQSTANKIVREAWDQGIRQFDTAQAYGVSEAVLGRAFQQLGHSAEALVISKFDPNLDHLDAKAMSQALDESLERLSVPSLLGMMIHCEEMLPLWDHGLGKILKGFVVSGKVKHTGISVYSPEKALKALNTEGIDILQVPANVLDRRFDEAGVFHLAKEKKKTLYIRSVFLQGLLVMKNQDIPEKMNFARPVVAQVEALADELGLGMDELTMGYLRQKLSHGHVIFGAESPEQVRKNIAIWGKDLRVDIVSSVERNLVSVDPFVLRPDLWPK